MAHRSIGKRILYDASRQLARGLFAPFFRIRCRGRRHYPSEGGFLVCANHQSALDPILIGLTCDRRMNYLARKTLFKFTPLRMLMEMMDAIPIERDGMGIGGIKETIRRLRRGEIVVMFPEGTRTADGSLSAIKPGFAALVRRTRVPILPLAIDGAFQSWPKGQVLPRRETIHIEIGQPIPSVRIAEWSDAQLVAAVTDEIQRCLSDAQRSRLASSR